MIERYGQPWIAVHGTVPGRIAELEWGDALNDLSDDEIRRGFTADIDRAKDFPPSSAMFRALARPVSDAPRTYLGTASVRRAVPAIESEQTVATAKRELRALHAKLGIPLRDFTP